MNRIEDPEQPPDFFISRAGADAPFAAEVGRILEDAGHTVVLQQWDFANRNFMERMHAALESGARVIALLSSEYLASDHCAAEWQNVIAHDPLNKHGRLVVLRVAECTPTGLLTALAYWDLVPVRGDGALLREIVLTAVKPGRHKDDAAHATPYWRAARPIVHAEIRETPSFTDREGELASLYKLLWAGHTAAVTQPVAAHGLGGIGKSALAREYAHRHQRDYAGVWWLNAGKPADGTAGFEGVERALIELGAILIRGLDQTQERAKAARHTLDLIAHGGFDKPWLLVYDNVDDARVLRDWAPAGNGHVLVTSRLSGWPGTVKPIEIEEWALPDAIHYLREESGRSDLTEQDATDVALALGRLPLALSHAAALLQARRNITTTSYLASLTRRMHEAPPDAEYPRAVFATFQEAIAQAEREARGAGAVISLAAFFAPDDVPEELFAQPAERYPPALAELLAVPGGMDDAIGALAHLSLVDFHPDKRTFSVHRLVQAAARDALGDTAPAWSNSALGAVHSAFPVPEFRTWPACERLVAHVRAVASHVTEDSRELAWLLGTTGDYLRERAALAEVLPLYERTRAIFERITQTDPANAEWQRDLSVSLNRIGDLRVAEGERAGALEAYQQSRAIREQLAARDPANALWQRDLSVSLEKIGDLRLAEGERAGALEAYQQSREVAEKLAARDPANAEWQRDLSVSLEKIGDLRLAEGERAGALEVYQQSRAIREELAARDPANALWQRDLSVSLERIGNLRVAEGERAGALEAYQQSRAIFEKLAEHDPANALWQRDLSVSLNKIGDLRVAEGERAGALEAYQQSRALREQLAARDPANAVWQRDLSVSLDKIGDLRLAEGERAGALEAYQQSRAIAENLAARDPANAEWQRDLSVSLNKIGDLRLAEGERAGALEAYQQSRALREQLAARDPANAVWQRDLIVSHWKLADLAEQRGEPAAARRHWQAALAIASALDASGRLAPSDAYFVGTIEERLAQASEAAAR